MILKNHTINKKNLEIIADHLKINMNMINELKNENNISIEKLKNHVSIIEKNYKNLHNKVNKILNIEDDHNQLKKEFHLSCNELIEIKKIESNTNNFEEHQTKINTSISNLYDIIEEQDKKIKNMNECLNLLSSDYKKSNNETNNSINNIMDTIDDQTKKLSDYNKKLDLYLKQSEDNYILIDDIKIELNTLKTDIGKIKTSTEIGLKNCQANIKINNDILESNKIILDDQNFKINNINLKYKDISFLLNNTIKEYDDIIEKHFYLLQKKK